MAKRIRVSDDGTTFYTLPGNAGETQLEANDIEDTVFGQDFSSTFPGIIGSTVNANGLFKGSAGYMTTIKKVGSSTVLTDEPMSLVSGKTYQVTDATKRALNRAVATTIEDDGTPVSASNIESIDWLFGKVTFVSGYTIVGAITIASGAYFPLATVGCANSFTLTQQANANDNTCMETARSNNGYRTFEGGLKTVSLELQGIFKTANGFRALLQARSELIIEVDLAGDGKTMARGFFRPSTTGQSGNVGELETETITFNLSVPQDDAGIIPYPFAWNIASDSPLAQSLQICLEAWATNDILDAQYLHDGTNGFQAAALITDLSLSGGLEQMNEFTVNFQLSGAPTDVP